MQYVLTEFTHDIGFRVFAFEGVGKDRVRMKFTVRADLALIARYGIRVQELPLLCLGILERRGEHEEQRNFTYTEADMRLNADRCLATAAALQQKKLRRSSSSQNVEAVSSATLVHSDLPG